MTISTSIWVLRTPNAGQKIQQLNPSLHLTLFKLKTLPEEKTELGESQLVDLNKHKFLRRSLLCQISHTSKKNVKVFK